MHFTHQVRYYHYVIVKIIVESFSLIQMSKLSSKVYHHDGKELDFYKIVHVNTYRLRKKKNAFYCKKQRISIC